MVNGEGHFILEPLYDEISSCFWGDLGFVKMNGKFAFINSSGKQLTDYIYDKAAFIMAGYGIGVMTGKVRMGTIKNFLFPLKDM